MKKRFIAILAVALLLTTLLPVLNASALIGPQYVNTSNGKGVNIRSGPSKGYEIIGAIPFGAMANTFEYYDGTWAYVSYNGVYGYAMTRYFSSTPPTYRPTPTATKKPSDPTDHNYRNFVKTDYYVTVRPSTPSGYVNLRWGPSKATAIQSTYYAGYNLHVIAQDGTWAQVYDDATNTCGFMMRSFLTELSLGATN